MLRVRVFGTLAVLVAVAVVGSIIVDLLNGNDAATVAGALAASLAVCVAWFAIDSIWNKGKSAK